jgi:propanediol dehydratase small subunit
MYDLNFERQACLQGLPIHCVRRVRLPYRAANSEYMRESCHLKDVYSADKMCNGKIHLHTRKSVMAVRNIFWQTRQMNSHNDAAIAFL